MRVYQFRQPGFFLSGQILSYHRHIILFFQSGQILSYYQLLIPLITRNIYLTILQIIQDFLFLLLSVFYKPLDPIDRINLLPDSSPPV